MDVAVAACNLVLNAEREPDLCDHFFHVPIVFISCRRPQDLTSSGFSGSGDSRLSLESRR
jgi:hypothetical protein